MIRALLALGRWYLIASGLAANLALAGVLAMLYQRGPEWRAGKVEVAGRLFDRVYPGAGSGAKKIAAEMRRRAEAGIVQVRFAPFAYVELPPRTAGDGTGNVLRVGPGERYARPSDAARAARAGDIVLIAPGVYSGDTAVWNADRLTIRGDRGTAQIDAHDTPLPEAKGIWLIRGDDITVEHIEFTNARSRDRNGAGIRSEGRGLVVRNCYFHHNENGILTNNIRDSEVLIEHSEFAYNGHPNGQAHNLYVGVIARLTLRANFFHHAVVGSQVKSRARENYILYNRILDAFDGRANYDIDLSDGGRAVIAGNVIEQGPRTENYHLIAFAPEHAAKGEHDLMIVHNTLVNERNGGRFVWNNAPVLARVFNNLFVGSGRPIRGPALAIGNVFVPPGGRAGGVPADTLEGVPGSMGNRIAKEPGFFDRQHFDYRLNAASPAIDAGHALTPIEGLPLPPEFEPTAPRVTTPRKTTGHPDAGAFEFSRL